MRTTYEKITDMRGNLITVIADNVGLGELARIDMQDRAAQPMHLFFELKAIKRPCRYFRARAAYLQAIK